MKFNFSNSQKTLWIIICILWGSLFLIPVKAQENFYWDNGAPFSNRIVEANERELKYEELKGDSPHKRTVDRENVVVAFNAYGMYMVIDQIPTNPEDSRMTLTKFYNARGCPTDVLIKATPLEVIPATIRMEGEAINYLTESGKPASIKKSDLVAILYKNGSHQLLFEPGEAKSFLKDAFDQVRRYCGKVAPKPVRVAENLKIDTAITVIKTSAKHVLSETEYTEYSKRALVIVGQFADYLQIIASRDFSMNERDVAIRIALKLFMPGTTIKVSSKNRKDIREYSLESYLKRLRLLPYGQVEIKWSNIEYIDKLKQEADGNYYGRIVGSQTFTGFSEKGESVKYSDVTRKDVRVKLQSYEKKVNGQSQLNWTILLGNIGVLENE